MMLMMIKQWSFPCSFFLQVQWRKETLLKTRTFWGYFALMMLFLMMVGLLSVLWCVVQLHTQIDELNEVRFWCNSDSFCCQYYLSQETWSLISYLWYFHPFTITKVWTCHSGVWLEMTMMLEWRGLKSNDDYCDDFTFINGNDDTIMEMIKR